MWSPSVNNQDDGMQQPYTEYLGVIWVPNIKQNIWEVCILIIDIYD